MSRSTISLWDQSAEEREFSREMDGDVATDVAIIGGGFTGLSTALHTAQRGIDCHVLEARHIGYGGSGRNVGLVNAGLWLPPQEVRDRLGEKRGADFIRILGEAPAYVFSLIEKHQIRCEATQNGTIHAAHSPKGFEDLTRRTEEWHRLGAPVDLLSKEEAAEKIGSFAFYGGLLDHRAGTINPMGYVRGLARAASGAGAEAGNFQFRISIGGRGFQKSFRGRSFNNRRSSRRRRFDRRKSSKRRSSFNRFAKKRRKFGSSRRVRSNNGSSPRSRPRNGRRPTTSAPAKCASGLRVKGVCMSQEYKRQLTAANEKANKARLFMQQYRRCDAKFEAQQKAGADIRTARNAVTRCMEAVNKRFE